ncbi:7939_t:CDS:2, partial [Entrophospora sp. SA101]
RKGTKSILNEKKFSVKEFQTRIQQRVHEKSLYASVVSKEIFVVIGKDFGMDKLTLQTIEEIK